MKHIASHCTHTMRMYAGHSFHFLLYKWEENDLSYIMLVKKVHAF